MAEGDAALGLLGGLLAAPYSIPAASQRAQQDQALRAALQGSGGQITPDVTNTIMQAMLAPPAPSLGHNIPVLGSILQGVGTVGRVLQSVAGTGAAPAPRPMDFLNAIGGIQKLQTSQKRQDIVKHLTNPEARELAEAGAPLKVVYDAEHPKARTPNSIGLAARSLGYDPNNLTPEQAREVDQHIDAQKTNRAVAQGTAMSGVHFNYSTDKPTAQAIKEFGLNPQAMGPDEWEKVRHRANQIEKDTASARASGKGTQMATSARTGIKFLERAKLAIHNVVTTNPVLAATGLGKLGLQYRSMVEGNPDAAFLVRTFPSEMPKLARALGEVRPTVLEEIRLRHGNDYANMTMQEANAVADEMLNAMRDIAKEASQGGAAPEVTPDSGEPVDVRDHGAPPAAPSGNSEQWHKLLDDAGVPR